VGALDRIMAALLAAEGAPATHAACGAEIRRPVRA
jgi:hypothetical protein